MNVNSSKKSYQLTESTNTLTFNSSSLKNSCISPKTCKNNIRFVRKIDVELNSLLTNSRTKNLSEANKILNDRFYTELDLENERQKMKYKSGHKNNWKGK